MHDDVIKWKHFSRYWPFVRGIHRSPVNSPHKGQWRGALMFSLICAWHEWLNKHSWGWWLETLSRPLWRHSNVEFAFQMTVVAHDQGNPRKSAEATVSITVQRNEFPPVFHNAPYSQTVSENIRNGSGIFTIQASDQDLQVTRCNKLQATCSQSCSTGSLNLTLTF